jgi:hypothetical protein
MFKINKDIPLPPRGSKKTTKAIKYPFAQMSPGDSFFVPLTAERKPEHTRIAICQAFREWQKSLPVQRPVVVTTRILERPTRVGVWMLHDPKAPQVETDKVSLLVDGAPRRGRKRKAVALVREQAA